MNSNSLVRALALLVCVWPFAGAGAQTAAGRIVSAVGEVSLVRGTQQIPAAVGSAVLAGDTVMLGKQSNAQVLFTDNATVALRPESALRVSEYAFATDGAPEAQRALFELVKGGLRTVTGLIARLRDDRNYRITTKTAWIGVRGTHYALVHCDDDCRNADGSMAANGTYGTVTDGRIAVVNQSGEHVFGANEVFRVDSIAAMPQQLIAAPAFLRDALEARARARRSDGAPAAGVVETVAQTGDGASNGDNRISGNVGVAPPPAPLANAFQVTNLAAETDLLAPALDAPVAFYRAGNVTVPVAACQGDACGTIHLAEVGVSVSFVLGKVYVSFAATADDGNAVNVGTPSDLDGIALVRDGAVLRYATTIRRADFPTQNGAFRCSACGPGTTPGYYEEMIFSGTVSATGATLTATLSNALEGGRFEVSLTPAVPPNGHVAAAIIPSQANGTGGIIQTAAAWNVDTDATGNVVAIGPLAGNRRASLGSASNVVSGTDASAARLRWGYWSGAGAQAIGTTYVDYVSTSSFRLPWIIGEATGYLAPSLGVVTYAPIGGVVNGGSGVIDSASMTADFVNRFMTLDIVATNPGSASTYTMHGSSGFSATTGRFAAGFSTLACHGSCPNPNHNQLTGSFGGFFAGPSALGAGAAFTAGYGSGGGVSGVVAFHR